MHNTKTIVLLALFMALAVLAASCAGGLSPAPTITVYPHETPLIVDDMADTGISGPVPIALGGYVETPIESQAFGSVLAVAAHGGALYIAAEASDGTGARFYRYENGAAAPLDYLIEPPYQVECLSVGPDGALSALCSVLTEYTGEESGRQATLSQSNPDETGVKMVISGYSVFSLEQSKFALQFTTQEAGGAHVFIALGDERWLLGDYSGVSSFSAGDDGMPEPFITGYVYAAALEGDTLYALTEGEDFSLLLTSYAYPSGKKTGELPIPGGSIYTNGTNLTGDGQGGAYIVNDRGLFHLNKGGGKLEQLLEGMSYAFGDTASQPLAVCLTEDGAVYVLLRRFNTTEGGVRGALYSYAWSDDAPVYAKRELTVASLNEHPMMKEAIAQYMREHKDVSITYRTYLSMNYAYNIGFNSAEEMADANVKIKDALRALNTEILAGNIPDIMLLDNMPLNAYISKGYLDDMSAWAEGYIDSGVWLGKIAGAYRQKDGALPCLPMKFAVPSIWGDAALVSGLDSLDDLAAAAGAYTGGGHLFDLDNERSLLISLFPIFAAHWTGADGKVQFTEERLTHLLKSIKTIQDALPAPDDSEGNNTADNNLAAGVTGLMPRELGHRGSGEIPCSLLRYDDRSPAPRALPALPGKTAFISEMIVGVSARSPYKDIAYGFLDLMLSESFLQDLSYDYGYSVVTSVCEKAVRTSAQRFEGITVARVGGAEIKVSPMDEATIQAVLNLLTSADTPTVFDYTLMTMIIEECTPYLRGARTLEETVGLLYNRTRAYLAE